MVLHLSPSVNCTMCCSNALYNPTLVDVAQGLDVAVKEFKRDQPAKWILREVNKSSFRPLGFMPDLISCLSPSTLVLMCVTPDWLSV